MGWEMPSHLAEMCHLVTAKCKVMQTQLGKTKVLSGTELSRSDALVQNVFFLPPGKLW